MAKMSVLCSCRCAAFAFPINRWKGVMSNHFESLHDVTMRLIRLMAKSLHLDDHETFVRSCSGTTSTLKLIRYAEEVCSKLAHTFGDVSSLSHEFRGGPCAGRSRQDTSVALEPNSRVVEGLSFMLVTNTTNHFLHIFRNFPS